MMRDVDVIPPGPSTPAENLRCWIARHPPPWLPSRADQVRTPDRSVFRLEHDDDIRRLGLVRRQAGQFRIAPVCKVYDCPFPSAPATDLPQFDDAQSIPVQEERVVAEQFI